MAGCGDKKIYQWDSDTGDLVQVSIFSNVHICQSVACLSFGLIQESLHRVFAIQYACQDLPKVGKVHTALMWGAEK